jgi:hypothetical protein
MQNEKIVLKLRGSSRNYRLASWFILNTFSGLLKRIKQRYLKSGTGVFAKERSD